jgi:hypothetical protein
MSEEFNNENDGLDFFTSEEEDILDNLVEGVVEEDVKEEKTHSEEVAEELGIEASVTEDKEDYGVIITGPSYSASEEVQSMGVVSDGVIGATKKPRAKKATSKAEPISTEEEKVAIHSDKNYYWAPVGKIYKGYNIVKKSKADKWITKAGVRLATPEEVAKEFGA